MLNTFYIAAMAYLLVKKMNLLVFGLKINLDSNIYFGGNEMKPMFPIFKRNWTDAEKWFMGILSMLIATLIAWLVNSMATNFSISFENDKKVPHKIATQPLAVKSKDLHSTEQPLANAHLTNAHLTNAHLAKKISSESLEILSQPENLTMQVADELLKPEVISLPSVAILPSPTKVSSCWISLNTLTGSGEQIFYNHSPSSESASIYFLINKAKKYPVFDQRREIAVIWYEMEIPGLEARNKGWIHIKYVSDTNCT